MEYIVNIFGNIVEIYTALLFYSKVGAKKFSTPIILLWSSFFTFFQFINTNLLLKKSFLIIIASTVFFFLVSLLFNIRWLHRILLSAFLCSVSCFSELIVAMIVTSLLNVDLVFVQEDIVLFSICTIISKYIFFTVIRLIKLKNNIKFDWLSRTFYVKIIPLPLASLLSLLLLFECSYITNKIGFRIMAVISSVLLILANALVFEIIERQNNYIETKEQLFFAQTHIKNQVSHYKELYNYQKELKTFRHDFKNKIISLMGYIKQNDNKKALESIESWINAIDEKQYGIINTGNPVLDAVIQSKYSLAKKKGIVIKVISQLANKIEIDEIEIGVLIGNILDNAIEAAEKTINSDQIPIQISLVSTEEQLSIKVTNPVYEYVNTEKLYSTKKDSQNHGYGVKSIEAIARKYGGEVFFSCTNNTFNTSVCLVNRSI